MGRILVNFEGPVLVNEIIYLYEPWLLLCVCVHVWVCVSFFPCFLVCLFLGVCAPVLVCPCVFVCLFDLFVGVFCGCVLSIHVCVC